MMVDSMAGKPGVRTASRLAYAARTTGILANLLLVALYVLLGLQTVLRPSPRPRFSDGENK
jgi:hypothetical protein